MMLWQRKLRYRLQGAQKRTARRNKKRGFLCLFLGGILALSAIAFVKIEARIGPLAQQAAISQLNGVITKEVNRVVYEVVAEANLEENPLMTQHKDENGKIISMTTDFHTVNQMKAEMAIRVQRVLDELDVICTDVPVGLLFSDSVWTGVGFPVPVRVFATNAIEVTFQDHVSSAGINQAQYQMLVEIKVPARVAGLLRYEDTCVVTQVPLEATVLIGEVPQNYFASRSQ